MNAPTSFLSLAEDSYAELKDRGSRFLAYAFPVADEEEVKAKLQQLREQYPDATHHCYAWVLGADGERYRANDDGEPNHSAGTPIYRQITSFGLSQVLVVVVRYYGGTKLGVPGLIQAYGSATRMALEASSIIEKKLQSKAGLRYGFQDEGLAYRIVKQLDAVVLSLNYMPEPEMEIQFDLDKLERIPGLQEQFPSIEIICEE